MVNLLAKLLGPIFEPMGVSQADLLSYIGMVQSYVWVILAAIVALIVVLILAKNAQKGKKHLIRWSAVLAWLAIVALTVNLSILPNTGLYISLLPPIMFCIS